MAETALRIEVTEKGTKEFYKEVVCVTSQYQRLIRKPESKVNDAFKQLRIYIAICAVFLVLITGMGIAWGMDALTILAIAVMLGVIAIAGALLYRLSSAVNRNHELQILEYLRDNQPSVRVITR